MRFTKVIVAAAALALVAPLAAQAGGGNKIYAYHSSHNFCPAGLQPVTMDGTICCGRPNQSMTYQQVMAHPVAKKKRVHRVVRHVRRSDCPIGTKGCTFD